MFVDGLLGADAVSKNAVKSPVAFASLLCLHSWGDQKYMLTSLPPRRLNCTPSVQARIGQFGVQELKQREVIEVSLNRDCGVEPAMTVRAIVGRGRFFSTAQDFSLFLRNSGRFCRISFVPHMTDTATSRRFPEITCSRILAISRSLSRHKCGTCRPAVLPPTHL